MEADDALKNAQQGDLTVQLPFLDNVLDELRQATSNFSAPEFLAATRAPRRQKPTLFTPRR